MSTLFRQTRAVAFYRGLGFYEIERYNDLDDELFLQLDPEHHDDDAPTYDHRKVEPGRS